MYSCMQIRLILKCIRKFVANKRTAIIVFCCLICLHFLLLTMISPIPLRFYKDLLNAVGVHSGTIKFLSKIVHTSAWGISILCSSCKYLATLVLGHLSKPFIDSISKLKKHDIYEMTDAIALKKKLVKFCHKRRSMGKLNLKLSNAISKCFKNYLIKRYLLHSYSFNLFMEVVVEVMFDSSNNNENDEILELLQEVMQIKFERDTSSFKNEDDLPLAFSIWYMVSLLLKKKIDQLNLKREDYSSPLKTLEDMIDEKNKYWRNFIRNPLAWEVRSRWEKRANKLNDALSSDKKAIALMGTERNHALYASYVSTICKMFESEYVLDSDEISHAENYIDLCVKERPNYGGKYNLLRAELKAHKAYTYFALGVIHRCSFFKRLNEALKDVEVAEEKDKVFTREDQLLKRGNNWLRFSAEADLERCDSLRKKIEGWMTQDWMNIQSESDVYVPKSDGGECCNSRVIIIDGISVRKPMEDYYINDDSSGIYIVMDGVTRPHEEYKSIVAESASFVVAHDMAEEVKSVIKNKVIGLPSSANILDALREAVKLATERIDNRMIAGNFTPCAVGIISIIKNSRFYFVAMGDCVGVVLRDRMRLFFGTQNAIEALSKLNMPKEKIYSSYLNKNVENGYAVFNGDVSAISVADTGSFNLEKDDIVILGTDGVRNYLKYADLSELRIKDVKTMLKESQKYDSSVFSAYVDDKAVIKISNTSRLSGANP